MKTPSPYFIIILFLLLVITSTSSTAQDDVTPPEITIISPLPESTINTTKPIIIVEYSDESGIDINSFSLYIDGNEISDLEEDFIETTDEQMTYTPSDIISNLLSDGNHTLRFVVEDLDENRADVSWTFRVDTTTPVQEEGVDFYVIILYIVIGIGVAAIAFSLYIFYLKKTKKFTFEKYFIQHPIKKEFLTIYVPFLIAFLFIIFSIFYLLSFPSIEMFSFEYMFVIGFIIAVTPLAFDSIRDRRRIDQYEHAFAQFLFEMADAMRGGLDPTKAILELAKNDTSIMKENLKKAAENIKLGRPFNEVMEVMTKNTKSSLIQRYASIIGETSKVGGETSQVIHRTAKDMDDFIKINAERRRQLNAQTTIIYIAFGVLMVVLFQLVSMFPSLQGLDASLFGASSAEALEEGGKEFGRMSFITLKQRFFHLVLINSIGTGLVIGQFVEGKPKQGLIHSIVMVVASVLFFFFLIFPQ